MNNLSEFSNGVKFLLVIVDVFSCLVRVPSIKSKYPSDAVAAFKKNVKKDAQPDRMWVYRGTNFRVEFLKKC